MTRPKKAGGGDHAQVREAARRVGLAVGVASAVLMATVALVISLVIVFSAREEGTLPGRDSRRPPGGPSRWNMRVVSVGDIVPVIVVLAVLGVLLLALIAWMAARRSTRPLAKALETQRHFVADASHELRTPLTTLDARIQLAQNRLRGGGDVEGALESARQDASALQNVLNDLLLAAEGTNADATVGQSSDLEACVQEGVRLTAPQARARGVDVVVEGEVGHGCRVQAADTAVTRALVLLVDNAIGYSPRGTSVVVSAKCSQTTVAVRVTDQGGGVDQEDGQDVFERFARGKSVRRGFGLGLALVQDIALRFGGTVAIEKTGPSGTTFLLELPSAPAP